MQTFSRAATKLSRAIRPPETERVTLQRRQVEIVMGEITATGTTVSLKLRGETTAITGIARLASYTPTIGDFVFCLMWDSNIIVIGKEA